MISRSLLLSSSAVLRRSTPSAGHRNFHRRAVARPSWALSFRSYATKSQADIRIEEITELSAVYLVSSLNAQLTASSYGTARDEFEIAAEETEKKSIYAAGDRAAAKEELNKLKAAFEDAMEGSTPKIAAEIKARVGERIRELENAVTAMEEMATED